MADGVSVGVIQYFGDRHTSHVAEVIEPATTEFTAQCLEPKDLSFPVMPLFGSWVKSYDEESGKDIGHES